jgi:signal transduction histidine kinase/ligand-binding sensor domain-containing protein
MSCGFIVRNLAKNRIASQPPKTVGLDFFVARTRSPSHTAMVLPAAKSLVRRAMLLLCILPVLAVASGRGNQDYVIKVWGPDDGLTEDSVTDVAQTPEGYLWIGTLFGSVLRFDGTRFVSYNSANTPQFSLKWGVPRLMVDGEGTLWISMYDGGLTAWNPSGFHAMSATNRPDDLLWSSPGKIIFVNSGTNLLFGQKTSGQWTWQMSTPPRVSPQPQFCADASGKVWYLRADGRIGTWDGSQSEVGDYNNQPIKVLAADGQGRIWTGTSQTLAVWQGHRFEVMTPTNGEAALNVKRIIPAGESNLWVEANGRMRCCVGRQWLAESDGWNQEMGRRNSLRFVTGDRDGGFWSSAGDLGLIHVAANGDFSQLTTRDGLPSNTIHFIYEDRDGNIWTGYDRGELVQLRRRMFRDIGKDEGLSDSLVNTVCEDTNGALWIGTHSGAVFCYANGACTNVSLPEMARAQESCVASDNSGRIWIGAQGVGLLKLENGQVESIASEKLLGGYPRLLLPTHDGRLWVGTLFSINCAADGNVTLEYSSPAVGGHPTALAEAADGTIWAGTLDGSLLRWDGKQFISMMPPEKNSLGRIWALWPAPDGSLWAGTEEGGLLHWSAGKFFRYTTKDGLPSSSIEEVLGDAQGNLWLGTRAGIARIPAHAFIRAEGGSFHDLPVSIYGLPDGLLTIGSAIIYQPNCWNGHDGTLYFAMANSIAAVDPGSVRLNSSAPNVTLERMLADDKEVFPTSGGAILTASGTDGNESAPPAINIGPGRGDLEFDYTGLSFRSPSRIRFKYKLDGLENSWNDAGMERKAIYRHVPPGRYVFRVMAGNSDSVWSGEGALLAVAVAPFFYQTIWFRGGIAVLAVVMLSCAAAIAMRRRMRLRVEQLERQHELERERSRIAQDLHDDLGAGLTEIGLLGGMLQDTPEASPRKQEALDRIVQRCHDLVTGLDEIVWAVNPRNDSVKSLGSYLCRYAQRFLEPAMRCRLEMFTADRDYPLNSEERHHLFLAFKEALTNVAKHSHATEVRIKISIENSELIVQVEDDGHGLPEAVEPGGNGLVNLRQRMYHIGGQCDIASRAPGGVSVRLSLPLKNNDNE